MHHVTITSGLKTEAKWGQKSLFLLVWNEDYTFLTSRSLIDISFPTHPPPSQVQQHLVSLATRPTWNLWSMSQTANSTLASYSYTAKSTSSSSDNYHWETCSLGTLKTFNKHNPGESRPVLSVHLDDLSSKTFAANAVKYNPSPGFWEGLQSSKKLILLFLQ